MTNGELIQKFFNCKVCEPIPEDDIIHVIFSDKNDSAIGFDWSWWNMEYKKPSSKNDLGVDCISRQAVLDLAEWFDLNKQHFNTANLIDEVENMPSVTPQEPMIVPIAEIKFDEDKLKELVDKAVFTAVMPKIEPRKGRWMKSNIGGAKVCSVCNAHMGLSSFKFCPNCGADMREGEE